MESKDFVIESKGAKIQLVAPVTGIRLDEIQDIIKRVIELGYDINISSIRERDELESGFTDTIYTKSFLDCIPF